MESSEKRAGLWVGGMTCVNCQNKIEKELNGTRGVIKASVSYKDGTAEVIFDPKKVSLKKIISVIEGLGYEVLREKQGADLKKNACFLVSIAALYVLLQTFGILNLLVPGQLADTGMGYGMLFVIGLITSVHCVAMCGGINISQCIPQGESEKSGLAVLRPALAYNLGRVCSYTAVGFVLGLAGFLIGGGGEVGISILFQGILKMAAGLFMVIMGVNMLGLFPGLRRFTVRVPKSLARSIGKKRAGNNRPFLVGILNGFLPCGPLQSMWLVALAAGNPLAGALSMLLFSLGTVPLMLGLGSIVSVLGRRFTEQVTKVGAVLVAVLGLAMVSQGGSLSGFLPSDLLMAFVIAFCAAGVLLSIPVRRQTGKLALRVVSLVLVVAAYGLWNFQDTLAQNEATFAEGTVVDGVQVVRSTLTPGSYPVITVQAGVPVQWVIDAPEGSVNGCNYKMLIPEYGIEYAFHTGENVIEFTPEEVGTVRYSCWMGMIFGTIYVTEDGQEAQAASLGTEISGPVPAGYQIPTEEIATAVLTEDQSGSAVQEVSIELTDEGFSPAVLVVQSGVAVTWKINNKMEDAQSGMTLDAPYYSTQLALGAGENQLMFYPVDSFDVSTADSRFYCYIKVVDDLSAVDEAAVREEVAGYETLIYPADTYASAGMSCCG